MLSSEEKKEIDEELAIVPYRRAACIGAMKIVQKHRGWISDDSLHDVAGYLGMSVHELDGVAAFYNLLFRKPVGRHIILVCDSVSCWIEGYDGIMDHLTRRLNIKPGETTEDGAFTLLTIPCLGLCDKAPAMVIDTTSYTDLTSEKIDRILEEVRNRG
jgi:NADH-quinone oxidoreductase subunit E